MVQNNAQDVLIFFHATWCGYCKNFSPVYDKLGELYLSNRDKVIIAKIDAIENDIDDIMEGIVVESFPTLYYVSGPKNGKKAVLYEGSRELPDLIEYINTNSGTSVTTENDSASHVEL
jgi:protein disulfide-isomerase-like protein